VFDDEIGVLQDLMVYGDHHAFYRRQHLYTLAFALHRAELLSLAYPTIQAGQLDVINLAEEISGKGIDSDASVLVAFVRRPGMAGMKAVALWDLEAGLLHHN